MKNSSRRNFLKLGAAAAGGAIAFRSVPAWTRQPASAAVVPALSLFEYSQIQLLEGLFRTQLEHNHKLFLGLDEDALLKPFRQRAGLPAPGPDMNRKSTRLNSSHVAISYAVFCLKKKKN